MVVQLSSLRKDLSWASPILRQRLEDEPRAVLREYGLDLPDDLPEHVVAEAARIVFLTWHDGRIISREDFHIDPRDEGLLFGRGVWESTRTVSGTPWLWSLHLERLQKTAELLGIALDPSRLPNAAQVRDFVGSLTTMDVLVRLNVSAGRPGHEGTVWMTASLPPVPSPSLRLQTVRYPFEKGHPYLSWKTFQYASRLELGRQATQAGYDSALLVDDNDFLLEAAHANVFVRLADGWVTPVADGGLLPGTTRQHLLESAPIPIKVCQVPRSELAAAQEIFVTNSNIGIVPVTQVDLHPLRIGSETMELVRWLQNSLMS